uniref:Uncharacterized protein n=1 Tax=Anguilla anguilla TaxID=7936 RepID=A0A0E9WCM5_ANGAN
MLPNRLFLVHTSWLCSCYLSAIAVKAPSQWSELRRIIRMLFIPFFKISRTTLQTC